MGTRWGGIKPVTQDGSCVKERQMPGSLSASPPRLLRRCGPHTVAVSRTPPPVMPPPAARRPASHQPPGAGRGGSTWPPAPPTHSSPRRPRRWRSMSPSARVGRALAGWAGRAGVTQRACGTCATSRGRRQTPSLPGHEGGVGRAMSANCEALSSVLGLCKESHTRRDSGTRALWRPGFGDVRRKPAFHLALF